MTEKLITEDRHPATRPDALMFVRDVAERLGRSEAQVRWMVHSSKLPKPAKIAGRICWKSSTIEAFIDAAFAEVA